MRLTHNNYETTLSKSKKLLRYFFSFALLLIGIAIGIAIRHYYQLPLADSVNIIDVATLLITVFLAVYVPNILDRHLEIMCDEGDVIEKRVTELQTLLRRINTIVQSGTADYEECLTLNNLLDICDHRLETITTLLSFYDQKKSYKQEVGKKGFCKTHRNLIFMEEVPQDGRKFAPDERNKEEELYNEIDRWSCLLLFRINSLK